MSKRLLVGLLMLLPWGTIAKADDYDPYLCQAFVHNLDPAFTVPANAQYRVTIDMRHCGGLVQNYQITLMGVKRDVPSATLMVLDSNGRSVGVSDAGHHCVLIGNVPSDAVYTVVVTNGTKHDESCILNYTGAI
jgi:hypothetical protein